MISSLRVVFFGTPSIGARVLRFLWENGVNIVGVVSRPDRPQGRHQHLQPTAVKLEALSLSPSLPVYQPELVSSAESVEFLKTLQPDLFVVVAFGEIVKQNLLDLPVKGCLNLHTSLLPKYRGAAPIQRCIMAGDVESGITIMQMVRKMDAGQMYEKVSVPVSADMTFGELEEQLTLVGQEALLRVIKKFVQGPVSGEVQDEAFVSFSPKVELEECEIDWKRPAKELHNLVRGVNPYPGAWCYGWLKGEKKRIKIHRTKKVDLEGIPASQPYSDRLWIACGSGGLELLELQLEGKKRLSGLEWLRGFTHISFRCE